MSIPGFERPWQVRAVLAGLEHERTRGDLDARHLAKIEEQERLFRRELDRMVAENVPEEPDPGGPDPGLAWTGGPIYSAWAPPR
jgi:hypothetical protein